MLAIPLVKPVITPNLDTSGLHRYLSSQQSQHDSTITADITALTNMRNSALSFTEPTDVAVQQLTGYCHQLKAFAPRFLGVETELNLSITWMDGFAAHRKTTASSFYFEWACCMWNLGAFESLRGARIDRTTEEGIRAANKHFQQAAGYFEYIREHLLPNIKVQTIPSLCEDSLLMVRSLMLAQAQLCFYEKAVKDKKKDLMKSAIIAKLAAQTSLLYAQASSACVKGLLGPLLDMSWFAIADFQSKCFRGAAEYWQAVASKEVALSKGTGYGEEIARYTRAESWVSQALALSKKYTISPSLPAGAEGLLSAIHANKKTAEYDLATVYMEGVPADGSLVEIVPVAMVKPSGCLSPESAAVSATEYPPVFRYVLPKELIESSRKFQEELTQLTVASVAEADDATNIGRVTLSSVGLPGSLEAVKSEAPLPDGLWSKVLRVQGMGGFDRLPGMFEDLQSSARRALLTMASIDEALDREERVDEEFRSRYRDWAGAKSSVLNVDIRANNKRMREAYANAQSSDGILSRELQDATIQEQLRMLSQSREQLHRLFPVEAPNLLDFDETAGDVHAKSTAAFGPDAVRLEERLHEMADLIETRSRAVEGIKKVAQLDFVELVASALEHGSASAAQLHTAQEAHLSSCREWRAAIASGVKQQEALLTDILQLNTSFLRSREQSPHAIQINEVIQRIEQSAAKYFSLHGQITAGVNFYSSLQSKLTTLLQSGDDLAYTQQWQRSEFEAGCTSAYQRTSQEELDHEYAKKLHEEYNTPAAAAAAPVAATAAAAAAAPAKPTKPAGPNPSNIVYGTAVSGPPASATMTYTAGAAHSVPAAAAPAPPAQSNFAYTGAAHPVPAAAPAPVAQSNFVYTGAPAALPAPHQPQTQPHQYEQPPGTIGYAQTAALPAPQQPQTPQQYQQHPTGNPQFVQPQPPVPNQYAAPAGAQYVQQQHQQQQQYAPVGALPPPALQQQFQQQHPGAVPFNPYAPQPVQPAAAAAQPTVQYQYNSTAFSALPAPAPQQHQPAQQPPLQPGQYYAPQPQQPPQQQYQQPAPMQYQPQQHQPPQPPQQQHYQQQPAAHQAPAQPAAPQPMTQEEFNRKVNSLCEMGFPRDNVVHALNANGGNEEASLNSLLGGSGPPPPPAAGSGAPHAAAPTTAAAPPSSGGGGFFGKIWGK